MRIAQSLTDRVLSLIYTLMIKCYFYPRLGKVNDNSSS